VPDDAVLVTPGRPFSEQLGDLQDLIRGLELELNMLRRRDEALHFYMQRMDDEMRLAAKLQQDFLPKSLPQVGRVHFHTMFRPAGYVSGDLYDVMRLDETHVGFFICDAVGHGMPAALLTMFIKRALVTKEVGPLGYRLLEPSQTIARINDALVEQNLSHATYATALYGVVNTQTLEMRLARGGHPLPGLLRDDGSLELLKSEGALLGIFPDEPFGQTRVQLRHGDRLLVYSDGVEIGLGGSDVDTHRWQEEVQRRHTLPSQQLISELSEEMDRQAGSLQPKDDVTIILMEVK
jgi:serine phosphatase RsbU (regulator of sigma subunit)